MSDQQPEKNEEEKKKEQPTGKNNNEAIKARRAADPVLPNHVLAAQQMLLLQRRYDRAGQRAPWPERGLFIRGWPEPADEREARRLLYEHYRRGTLPEDRSEP